MDFTVFAWFFALSVLFQLARGDMGLFRELRNAPVGATLGDGVVPQVWFACALLTLAWPRVWSVTLLSLAGLSDFWWRLPVVTPSLYFSALVSIQVLLTAGFLAVRRRRLTVPPAEFIDSVRTPLLLFLIGLFGFAAFHKLTYESRAWSGGFFHSIVGYYTPFPAERLSVSLLWLVTFAGELSIALALTVQRTRQVGLFLCLGFACFVGTVVYGFGAIVLAAVLPLAMTSVLFAPISQLAVTQWLARRVPAHVGRVGFALAIGAVFLLDHVRGFTLADRASLFPPRMGPTTADVLTLMQGVWFAVSTAVLVSALVSARRHRRSVAARFPLDRRVIAWALPVVFGLSELGLYTGLKDSPGFTMFSALRVKSCAPNHYIARDHLLSNYFHRDLLVVTSPAGEGIAMPALSLRALWERERRHGDRDSLVETYRTSPIRRLRAGADEPFRFEHLAAIEPRSWLEVALPRRLFFLQPASEADLRCSMPELFAPTPARSPG